MMFTSLSPFVSRRSVLKKLGLATCGAGLLSCAAGRALADLPAPIVQFGGEARDLNLYNPNTNERISTVFYAHGEYNPQSFNQLCRFMRDHHDNKTHWMDPRLLTMLYDLQTIFDKRDVHVISGYRTEHTNAILRQQFPGVAKDSFHMKGQAVDIRIAGVDVRMLRDVAKTLGVGGVGYYPAARFIHVDTGPIRTW
jgi:uncharacterized protein YcbK (DUF882 family)